MDDIYCTRIAYLYSQIMKQLAPLLTTFVMLFVSACTLLNRSERIHQKIIGNVFTLAESMDGEICEGIPPATDYWTEYLFLDDSTFIQIIYGCCAPSVDYHSTGRYRLKGEELLLRYDAWEVHYYQEETFDSVAMDYGYSDHVEKKRVGRHRDTLNVRDCAGTPYFEPRHGPWKANIMSLSDKQPEELIEGMKKDKVWDKLQINQ